MYCQCFNIENTLASSYFHLQPGHFQSGTEHKNDEILRELQCVLKKNASFFQDCIGISSKSHTIYVSVLWFTRLCSVCKSGISNKIVFRIFQTSSKYSHRKTKHYKMFLVYSSFFSRSVELILLFGMPVGVIA